jgi:hypothetical protein
VRLRKDISRLGINLLLWSSGGSGEALSERSCQISFQRREPPGVAGCSLHRLLFARMSRRSCRSACHWAELASNATIAQPQLGSSASSGLSRAPSQRRPLSWLVRPAHWRSFAASGRSYANGARQPSSWLGRRHLVDADAKSSAYTSGARGYDGSVHAAGSPQR